MSDPAARSYATVRIAAADVASGFSCGKHPLDDYFARHALSNDGSGVSRAYVLRRSSEEARTLPPVIGFYTLSMAGVVPDTLAAVVSTKLPRYPIPVALVGRLAVNRRAQGRRLGEKLLLDALHRVLEAAELVGCVGVIVDAKDQSAEQFYAKYDFVALDAGAWPRRMFLAIQTVREAVAR